MNKTILLIFALAIFASPVLAEDVKVDYYFQYGEAINISRECFSNGGLCSASYNCNLTVYAPNNTVVVDEAAMDDGGDNYNYLIPKNPLRENGVYRTRMSCSDGSSSGSEVFYFEVNPTGDDKGQIIFLILTGLSFVTLLLAFIFKNDYLGFISGLLFGLTGVYTMIYGISGLADIYTRGVAGTFVGLGILFVIVSAYSLLDES